MPSQYRAVWSTPGGGTGYTVLNFQDVANNTDAQQLADMVQDYFDNIKGIFPDDVTISFESEVLVMDLGGTLTAVFAVTPPTSIVGINTSVFNRAAGMRVDWGTGHIVAGRRLTGRTYLVPCGSSVFDTNGLVTAGNITAVQTNSQALITASSSNAPLVVWSRTHSVAWAADVASVASKGAILTGRRD